MADPRFFRVAGPFTLAQIAARTDARIVPASAADRVISDVAPLVTAASDQISFLGNRRYVETIGQSAAGAAFIIADHVDRVPASMTAMIVHDPYASYGITATLFYPETATDGLRAASAVIDPTARLGDGVSIGHHVVIEADVEIGRGTRVAANTVIHRGVVLGADCRIAANVTLSHCRIGDRAILHPGVCIGQDGFGFAPGYEVHIKIPQLGRVLIGDDVEIGANSTVDRGAGPDTVIGSGTKIDNLVQIGHNAVLGRGCLLVAQSGLAGSATLGDLVSIGGQTAIAGHLSIGEGARIAAKSGVSRNVAPGAAVGGVPAVPIVQWHRATATLARLARRRKE